MTEPTQFDSGIPPEIGLPPIPEITDSGLAADIVDIKRLYNIRVDFHSAEKRLTLQIMAICRRLCGRDKAEGQRLFKALKTGDHPLAAIAIARLDPFMVALDVLEKHREATEKELRVIAKRLPVYAWVKTVKGFGELNLANIIGEAGNLSNYSNPAKLWKRMGLAVIEGGRQRCVTDADLAVKMGYSPKRRAVAWNLGLSLIMATSPHYRAIYDSRKAYESEKYPELLPKHRDNRARRYMEKRAIRDLWRAWRGQVEE